MNGESLVRNLRALLGQSAVWTEDAEMRPFAHDWTGRYGAPPCCVVFPKTTEDVSAVVRLCAGGGAAVLPQGGNTSLCGGAVPSGTDTRAACIVVVSLARMDRVRCIDDQADTMTLDAGCVLATVQETARSCDRLFPVSLGAGGSCQIGGIVATDAGGTNVLRYGTTRDNILGLEVVLADGRIWNGLTRLRKNATGYARSYGRNWVTRGFRRRV